MSKLSDFKTDVPYLNEDQKLDLISSGEGFLVLAINLDVAGQYGPKWRLTCRPIDSDDVFRLSLSATQSHNDLFEPAAETVSTRNPLGPVRLVEVPTKAGRKFRTLEDAD